MGAIFRKGLSIDLLFHGNSCETTGTSCAMFVFLHFSVAHILEDLVLTESGSSRIYQIYPDLSHTVGGRNPAPDDR